MTYNYHPDGPGFTVSPPLEERTPLGDDTLPLPIVKTAAAAIMAAPADLPLTDQHRKVLDELDTLAAEARRHLAGWDGRESDSDPAAEAAMGWAITTVKQLVKVGRGLLGDLRFEDTTTAVEDDRESYSIRMEETGTV